MSNINFNRVSDFAQLSLNTVHKAVQKKATIINQKIIAIDQKIRETAQLIFKSIEAVFTPKTDLKNKASLLLALPALQKTAAKINQFTIKNSPSEKINTAPPPTKNKSHSLEDSFASLKASQLSKDLKATAKNIGQTFVGKKSDENELANTFKKLEKNVAKQLKILPENSPNSELREIKNRMVLTQSIIENNPAWVKEKIATYQNDPMYKQMGDVKFLSFLAASDNNLMKKHLKPEDSPLNEIERVALFGYTTSDYKVINPAARGHQESLNPGIKAYIQNTISAMKKLPDVEAPATETVGAENLLLNKEVLLKRTITTEVYPGWAAQTFGLGKTYSDSGFASASFSLGMSGKISLTMTSPKNAKDVSLYSAWPGEKEILIVPGTQYTVKEVTYNGPGSMAVVLEPKE